MIRDRSYTLAQPHTATHDAGVILDAAPPRVPVVLSDFQRVQLTEPCPQDELKRIQVHFMTLAQCAKRGLTSAADREAMGRTIADRMGRFGTSSEYIAARQVSVLNSYFVQHVDGATGTTAEFG